MASTTEPTVLKKEEEEEDEKPLADDEDTGAQIAPIVQLQEIAVTTGEENEDIILDLEANQWKERGVGTVKLLIHKETGKARLVMRQYKTLKICANHLGYVPTMTVQEHHGNEKSCVWHAADFADGELKEENFCIRFPSIENCKSFKDKIEEITESLAKSSGESEEGTTAANLIEKLTVEEKDTEEKIEAKEAPLSSDEKKEKSSDEK
ncbi:PREDICTED: ran-binding protein 1 homolog c-like [Erythranthe guttata]|nr:PREDICTED: ran-binding protein 1 homolog c-like [Erythranthe guttata]|eukprot:XP_012857736.1 PREDICTED: ran-binding protein 1 homolog c-like [Erythranthe guttata]